MPKFIAGTGSDVLSLAICEAVGLEPSDVRRILIDLEAGAAARVYYETFADTDKIEAAIVAWRGGALGELEIIDADEDPEITRRRGER